jgi:hypothetical protein
MRPYSIFCVAALLSSPALATPKALSCIVLQKEESQSGLSSSPQRQSWNLELIFVIDDAKKTVAQYSEKSGSLTPVCQAIECKLDYGAKQIRYAYNPGGPGEIGIRTMLIDRVSGTFERTANSFNTRTGSKFDFEQKGSCRVTKMPSLTAPEAQF